MFGEKFIMKIKVKWFLNNNKEAHSDWVNLVSQYNFEKAYQ